MHLKISSLSLSLSLSLTHTHTHTHTHDHMRIWIKIEPKWGRLQLPPASVRRRHTISGSTKYETIQSRNHNCWSTCYLQILKASLYMGYPDLTILCYLPGRGLTRGSGLRPTSNKPSGRRLVIANTRTTTVSRKLRCCIHANIATGF